MKEKFKFNLNALKKCNKTLKIMKISVAIFFLCIFNVTAKNVYSQKNKISVKLENITIKEAISKIEKASHYVFLVSGDTKNELTTKVNYEAKKEAITTILDAVLLKTDLQYRVVERQISLFKKEKEKSLPKINNENIATTQQKKRTIAGRVFDAKGKLLIGVNVVEVGTTNGAITDVNGTYSISLTKENAILKFSYIGFIEKEVKVGKEGIIDVMLNEDVGELDEVVVVGYGEQRKISVVGSQTSLKTEDIKQPTASLSSIISGRIAGVVAVQRSGEPGRNGADIWIRGITSPNSNRNPLVLVDGVERDFNDIDPEDVESFSVLKDASATAVYGVRGANGVVLIKTKPGRIGKPTISFDYYEGVTTLTKMPQMADGLTYMNAANEAYKNSTTGTYSPKYSEEYIKNTVEGTDPLLYPNINWMETVFNKYGHNRRANINIRGGSELAQYYASVSYYNEQGLSKVNELEKYNADLNYHRYNFTSNLNLNATKTTKIEIGVSGYLDEVNRPYVKISDILSHAMIVSPVAMPKMFVIGGKEYVPGINPNRDPRNPYAELAKRGYTNVYSTQIYSNLRITQDLKLLTQGLSLSAMYAFDVYNARATALRKDETTYYFKDRNNPYNEDGNPIITQVATGEKTLSYARGGNGNRRNYLEASLVYDRTFNNDHHVSGLLLFNQSNNYYNSISSDESIIDILPYRSRGLAARATYSWKDRYFGEINIGYNGSENFTPSKRYGFFPAIGLGWVVSNESFWQPLSNAVSFLKLRYTNGIVGNSATPDRFLYLGYLEYSKDYGYSYGKGWLDGVKVINDPVDVTWEESHKQNFGVDMKLFDNSLSITADYFKEHRTGIFLRRVLPGYLGLSSVPYGNIGIIDNKGVEASLDYIKRFNRELSLSLRGNITYNLDTYIENGDPPKRYPWMDRKGHNILARWGYVADGLFTQEEINRINAWESMSSEDKAKIARPFPKQFGKVKAGDIKYIDQNQDGEINVYDQVNIGRGDIPQIVYGFGFNLKYKNISCGTLFQGIARADRILRGGSIHPFNEDGGKGNLFSNIDNRWTEEDPRQDVFYPRLAFDGSAEGNKNNFQPSTWWIRDVGFLRLKSLQIAYDLPIKWTSKVGVKRGQIYFMGSNLLTFSKFKLWDPELNTDNGTSYPNIATYSIGVNFSF